MWEFKNIIKFDEMSRFTQRAVIIFASVSIEFVYVLWLKSVTAKNVLLASTMSMLLGLISLFGVTTIIERKWALPYWILGLGLGTALAMVTNFY